MEIITFLRSLYRVAVRGHIYMNRGYILKQDAAKKLPSGHGPLLPH
jgi:hypothetical protein